MRVSFDTNILVYAVDRAAERKHSLAVEVIGWASGADCVFTVQALGEFFNVVTRKTGLDLVEAEGFIDDWQSVFPVHSATPDCLASAIQAVRRHGLAFWDAMLWATARDAGCGLLIGEDFQDGRTLGGVTFVNPFLARNDTLLRAALAPIQPPP